MLLWRLEGNCETGDTQCINVKQVVVMESDCRLLSTDTIKDESLWEAESALAQLWEHEDRVVSKSFQKLCAISGRKEWTHFCSRITKRGPCVDLDQGGSKIFLSNSMQLRRR